VRGRGRCHRPLASGASALGCFSGSTASRTTRSARSTRGTTATARRSTSGTIATASTAATGTLAPATTLAVLAVVSVFFVTTPIPLGRSRSQHDGHVRSTTWCAHHLNATLDLFGRSSGLDRRQGEYFDPFETDLDISAEY
jgi:hypothetical protein